MIVMILIFSTWGYQPLQAKHLIVKVIKACETCTLPPAPAACQSVKSHWDRAGKWIPNEDIRIHAVSIPEQTEISIYADIEVSKAPEMYKRWGHIFRVKYAGPAINRDPPCDTSFSGSNITTTNIVFPEGYWISVRKGQEIYVHLDVINWSPYSIYPMAQDIYIYYTAVKSN
jgi:hypothetical protein